MNDISIELLEKIKELFDLSYGQSKKIESALSLLEKGGATYDDAQKYAIEVGEILADALGVISKDQLPNGKMYYNIARKILEPTLSNNYNLISDYSTQVQSKLNQSANIGLKSVSSELNENRIHGIAWKASQADDFDDAKWLLKDPVVQFSQSVVDDTLKSNADFHYKTGRIPTIKRTIHGDACAWCMNLAGTYRYPDVPDNVYQRHRDCRCVVTYDPRDGRGVQNVHTKQWDSKKNREKISNLEEIQKKEKDVKYKSKKVATSEDVTTEYYGFATPESGEIIVPQEYKSSEHKEEIPFAKFIHHKFGGTIELLIESNLNEIKTPDFIWKNKFWELKTMSSNQSADSAIRKAIKQINDMPGGIFLDNRKNSEFDLGVVTEKVGRRIARSNIDDVDVMIIESKEKIKVLRYKK